MLFYLEIEQLFTRRKPMALAYRALYSLFYSGIKQRANEGPTTVISNKLFYLEMEHHVTELQQDFLRYNVLSNYIADVEQPATENLRYYKV